MHTTRFELLVTSRVQVFVSGPYSGPRHTMSWELETIMPVHRLLYGVLVPWDWRTRLRVHLEATYPAVRVLYSALGVQGMNQMWDRVALYKRAAF